MTLLIKFATFKASSVKRTIPAEPKKKIVITDLLPIQNSINTTGLPSLPVVFLYLVIYNLGILS